MTAVETLREAARLMRERACAAAPSPWASGLTGIHSKHEDGGYIATHLHVHNPCRNTVIDPANRVHIASWHPAVALAVADWLDATARLTEDLYDEARINALHVSYAEAVARAYLGDQP